MKRQSTKYYNYFLRYIFLCIVFVYFAGKLRTHINQIRDELMSIVFICNDLLINVSLFSFYYMIKKYI